MAFQLQTGESVAGGIARAAAKQLKQAGRDVEALSGDEVVHDVRKRFKRVRALARLVRGSLGDRLYHRTNRLVRDAGKPLAMLRDAEVLIAALENLESRAHPHIGHAALEPVRHGLKSDYDRLVQKVLGEEEAGKIIADCIGKARQTLRNWKIASRGWQAVGQGLNATYCRGQESLSRATVDPSVANLHEWRKQVKYLMYQVEFIRRLRPRSLKKLEEKLNRVADFLGDDHDLATLAQTVRDRQVDWNATDVAVRLLAAIHQRRCELQGRALQLGERIYARPTEDFAARLKMKRNSRRRRPARSPR